MPGKHASEETLRRFFRSELARRETAELVQHLLTRCPQCLDTAVAVGVQEGFILTGKGFENPAFPNDADFYKTTFLNVLRSGDDEQMRLAGEKLRGIGLFAELEEQHRGDRLEAIRENPRFHSWGLFTRLIEKSQEYARNDPGGGVNLATLAGAVVELLDPQEFTPAMLADFKAEALAALGNAKRLAVDFVGARAALGDAWERLEEGTGDPLEKAHLIGLEASLLRDLGQFEEATAHLNRAIAIYRQVKDDNLWARALIKQATCIGYIEPDKAIPLLQDALGLLDAAEHPRLELCARHSLVWFLNDSGQTGEALALLELSRPLYKDFADPWTQLRLYWVEGRIARALGHLAEAESTYRFVWYEFEAKGMHHDLTLLAIDLAEVYTAQRKFKPAAELVNEFLPVLEGWGMHREGLAMWMLFRDAVIEHAAKRAVLDAAVFQQVAQYFQRAWRQPLHDAGQLLIS